MPYEREPGAYWALFGPQVEFRRTRYEPGDIGSSGWPDEWLPATPEEATECSSGCRVSSADTVLVGRVGKSHGLDGSFVVENASETLELFARAPRCSSTGRSRRSSAPSRPAAGR